MTPYYTSQLDWTTNRGTTQSSDTGPSVDQDTGTSQGYYIYTEASFTNVSVGYSISGTAVSHTAFPYGDVLWLMYRQIPEFKSWVASWGRKIILFFFQNTG